MVVIPQEEYTQLASMRQVQQPMVHQFQQLERQYESDAHVADPYRRLVLQGESLDGLKELKDKMREAIVSSSPKAYQSRARMLYQSTESFIKFNPRGEIYDEHGQLVENSRMEDLIQYAVRDRRRDVTPVGWKAFVNLLRNNNVPRFALNRDTIEELHTPVKPTVTTPKVTPETLKVETTKSRRKTVKRLANIKSLKRELESPPKRKRPRKTTEFKDFMYF